MSVLQPLRNAIVAPGFTFGVANGEHGKIAGGLSKVAACLLVDSGDRPQRGLVSSFLVCRKRRLQLEKRASERLRFDRGTGVTAPDGIKPGITGPRFVHAVVEFHGVHLGTHQMVVHLLPNRPGVDVQRRKPLAKLLQDLVPLRHCRRRVVGHTDAIGCISRCTKFFEHGYQVGVAVTTLGNLSSSTLPCCIC